MIKFKEILYEDLNNLDFAYHNTTIKNANSIKEHGFKIGDGPYGKGVYLTPSIKLYKSQIKLKVSLKNIKNIFRVYNHDTSEEAIFNWQNLSKKYDAIFVGNKNKESEIIIFNPKKLEIIK